MVSKRFLPAAFALAGLVAVAAVGQEANDPRVGRMSYEGSGSSERAPEYGEVFFNFNVACQASAEDVRKAIEAVSGRVWQAIAAKVPTAAFSEVQRTYWGNIGNIQESAGSYLRATPPQRTAQGLVPGSAKRVQTCTGKELALDAVVPTVFSGSQRFGVRTTDMDWLEGLVRTVQALPQGQTPDAVKFSVDAVRYEVTEGTKRQMLSETLEKARLEATGPDSKFQSDRRTLKFASAHYLGHRLSQPPVYHPSVGEPLARGLAPKVTLELPLVYTIYAEARDLIDRNNSRTEGVRSDYEIVGRAIVEADYAETSVTVSAACQASKADALKAVGPTADDILKELRDFHGNQAPTETDRVVNNEAESPQQYYPYQPVAWDASQAGTPVTKYLNTCTNQLVDAPASGRTSDLQGYWQVSRSFALKSRDFDGLLDLTESLQRQYNTATSRLDDTRVTVTDAYGQVTDATKRSLAIKARENATGYILNTRGPVAQDARTHGFTSAHLVSVRVGSPRVAAPRAAFRAMGADAAAESAPAGAAPDELTVDVVHKPDGERPQFRMVRHYAFDYRVVTEDYLRHLQTSPRQAPRQPEETRQDLL